uniref:TM2 domain-containing protein 3 n=1 Tax=Eptatretus burgeri TaxID=7764 RepID=A0A8C4R1Q3_EPTBU
MCPNKGRCSELLFDCFSCKYDHECIYGQETSGNCTVCDDETSRPQRVFHVSLPCRYCWQLPPELYKCENRTKCRAVNCPRKRHIVMCTVLADVHCLGKRTFQKMVYCNWTGGYKWSTALALSITLGGFGADRFYLGQWREGLGKLFSFGGLGVWTLLDVILIAVGYIGPADGSLYI